jgi:hypothetical protein
MASTPDPDWRVSCKACRKIAAAAAAAATTPVLGSYGCRYCPTPHCLKHRAPEDHACPGLAAAAASCRTAMSNVALVAAPLFSKKEKLGLT